MSQLNRIRLSFILLSFVILSACGGGGGGGDTTPTNNAPTAGSTSITDNNGGGAEAGDTLTGNYTYTDVESDAEATSTFRWLRNGTAISGATSLTYILVFADNGQSITFEVTPVAATGTTTGNATVSGGITVAANSAPIASNVSITDNNGGDAVVGDSLTGNYTYADTESDAEGTSTFRWLRNSTAISGATSLTYTLVFADNGQTITFEVIPVTVTGTITGSAVTSNGIAVNVMNNAPTANDARITDDNDGLVVVGDSLTGTYTYADAENDAEAISTFRWLRDGTAINGATSSSYTLVSADIPSRIIFEVTPVASAGTITGSPERSARIIAVNNSPVASNVSITDDNGGLTAVGDNLTGNYTYFDPEGDAEGASTFRWLRNSTAISDATSLTYTLVFADSGQSITFEITPVAVTPITIGNRRTSPDTIVNNVPIVSDVNITDNNAGNAEVGDTLTGSYIYADTESDAEGPSTFRWLRNGAAIGGATALTYVLITTDSDQSITFEVTPVAVTGSTTGNAVTGSLLTSTKSLNDTGVTSCGDYGYTDSGTNDDVTGSGVHNNNLDCSVQPTVPTQTTDGSDTDGDIVRGGQDALHGRDVTNNDDSDGHAGFSFTKLNSNGIPLADQSQNYATNPWSCVKDNVTGLIWEIKTNSGLQSGTYTYTWYNSTGINDGGDHGVGDTGIGTSTGYEQDVVTIYPGSDNCENSERCDIEKYVMDINALNICGEINNDWRLPTKHEISSIIDNSRIQPAVDDMYFPNSQPLYWTASPNAQQSFSAWQVSFQYGLVDKGSKDFGRNIRLVRGSQ